MVGGGWTGLPSVDGASREGAVSAKRSGYGSMLLTSAEARAIAANIYSWVRPSLVFSLGRVCVCERESLGPCTSVLRTIDSPRSS